MAPFTKSSEQEARLLIQRHQTQLWRYLRFLGCEAEQAEDLTQESFLVFFEKPAAFREEVAVAPYLRGIARNLFLKALRQKARDPVLFDVEASEAAWEDFSREDEGTAYLDALKACLELLEGKQRAVIELRYQDGWSRARIGQEIGMGEQGVKSLLRRTRYLLRGCVEGKLGA